MNKSDKYKKQVIAILPDLGKVPPQASDMEEAVLGAIMLDKECIYSIIDFLKPESFYRETHQKIFATVITLFKKNFPTDIFSVTEELRANQLLDSVGGPVYITMLSSKIVSAANVEYHARIIAQKYVQRELIRMSGELQSMSFDDSYDISELLNYAETTLLEISGRVVRKEASKLGDIAFEVVENIDKIKKGERKLEGVPSGFTNLDRHTTGFKGSELTIIAARPSMGKTATGIQIAKNVAGFGMHVAFFSCEMSKQAIAVRYLSAESGYSNNEINSAKVDVDRLAGAAERLFKYNIHVDDSSGMSISEIRAKTRRLIIQHKVKIVIVDYLQLMKGEGDNREQQVSSISRGLKIMAADFNIPVIVLAQLSREVEKRADKKPMLSDLRESGAIEQDADVVIFLHCPEKYGVRDYEVNGNIISAERLLIPIIAKNRNGPTGEIIWRRNDFFTNIFEEDNVPEFTVADPLHKLNPRDNNFDNEEPKF